MKCDVELYFGEEKVSYTVNVERLNKEGASLEDAEDNSAVDIVFSAVQNEYEHAIHRSEKLDNKIYILLTVCAFLFVLLSSLISNIKTFSFPETKCQLALIVSFAIMLALDTILFCILLIILICLLHGVTIDRFASEEALENDLFGQGNYAAGKFISQRYVDAMTSNNEKLEKKYKIFNKAIWLLIPIVIISIALEIFVNFI